VLSSSVVWLWWAGTQGWFAAFGSNTYVWISLGLLAAVPAGRSATYAPAARR
jgi:alpha-1,2-mannosyltransferase